MIEVYVATMCLSGGREEHYVRIANGDKVYDVRRYAGNQLNRAQYEVDELKHVLCGEPQPSLLDPKYGLSD